MILSGCVAFLKLNKQAEMELFNQIWEQIDHKYLERRLLVAESCGVLVPHVQVSCFPRCFNFPLAHNLIPLVSACPTRLSCAICASANAAE